MIVVDVETTGTNGAKHSILSIGAVDMLDAARRFYGECRIWDGAHVMEGTQAINGFTDEQMRDPSKKSESELLKAFFAWFADSEEQTLVGMNPSMDYEFLRLSADRSDIDFPVARRTIDLHTVCYMHMLERGKVVPVEKKHSAINSDFISGYVGIPPEPKPHIALNGALWEAEQLSRLFYDKPLIADFKEYPIPWHRG